MGQIAQGICPPSFRRGPMPKVEQLSLFTQPVGDTVIAPLVETKEATRESTLVGGLYGVRCGALFAAESMFHRERDASKVALASAIEQLFASGITLFDVQFLTPHLESLGAYEIPRARYLELCAAASSVSRVK